MIKFKKKKKDIPNSPLIYNVSGLTRKLAIFFCVSGSDAHNRVLLDGYFLALLQKVGVSPNAICKISRYSNVYEDTLCSFTCDVREENGVYSLQITLIGADFDNLARITVKKGNVIKSYEVGSLRSDGEINAHLISHVIDDSINKIFYTCGEVEDGARVGITLTRDDYILILDMLRESTSSEDINAIYIELSNLLSRTDELDISLPIMQLYKDINKLADSINSYAEFKMHVLTKGRSLKGSLSFKNGYLEDVVSPDSFDDDEYSELINSKEKGNDEKGHVIKPISSIDKN